MKEKSSCRDSRLLFYFITKLPICTIKNNLVMESGNYQKGKNMIEYQRETIVLQGGSLPKNFMPGSPEYIRGGGGANDSF